MPKEEDQIEVHDYYDPITNTYSDKITIIKDYYLIKYAKDGLTFTDSYPSQLEKGFFYTSVTLIILLILVVIILRDKWRKITSIILLICIFLFSILSCVYCGKGIFVEKYSYYYKPDNYIYKNLFKQNPIRATFFGISIVFAAIVTLIALAKSGAFR